jgi:Zn finger protein HypA/HybF involved in hydrogenase expression
MKRLRVGSLLGAVLAGPPLCPTCGSANVTLDGGDELILESLAIEATTQAMGPP